MVRYIVSVVGLACVTGAFAAVARSQSIAPESTALADTAARIELIALRSVVPAGRVPGLYQMGNGSPVGRDEAIRWLATRPKPSECHASVTAAVLAMVCQPFDSLSADEQENIRVPLKGIDGKPGLLGFLRLTRGAAADSVRVVCIGQGGDTITTRTRDVEQWFRDYPIWTPTAPPWPPPPMYEVEARDVTTLTHAPVTLYELGQRRSAVAVVRFAPVPTDRVGLEDIADDAPREATDSTRRAAARETYLISVAEQLDHVRLDGPDSAEHAYLAWLTGVMRRTWAGRAIPPMVQAFLERVDANTPKAGH